MRRFVITAIKKDGLRQLAGANNHLNTYATKAEATKQMKAIIKNNSPERVSELVGSDLKVLPVDCYPGGDATRTIF